MGEFFSDLRSALGLVVIKQVALKVRDNDLLGLAGQLAYFFLLSLFPFLIVLVALAGLILNKPESAVGHLVERGGTFLPQEAISLIVDYMDRTLRNTGSGVLLLGVTTTIWLGSAASISITKAANRAYEVVESRSFWKLRGTSLLLAVGFMLLIVSLVLLIFKVEVFFQGPDRPFSLILSLWSVLRWVVAFVIVTAALDILYYLAPNAVVSFRWITPGGAVATFLMFVGSIALSFYVTNLGNYNRIYGQLGAVIILMLWLYVTGLMVLVGIEVNAVLARRAERKLDKKLVHPEGPAKGSPEDTMDIEQ